MRIRIRETGAVVYDDEWRRLYPDTSFPAVLSVELLNDFGADPVLEGPQPELGPHQYAQYNGVLEQGGQWFTSYIAVDYTPEELQAQLEQARQSMKVSPFQAKAALYKANLLDTVEQLVNDPATDPLVKLAYNNATQWDRLSSMITTLATALNLSDAQVDDLFKEAAKIN